MSKFKIIYRTRPDGIDKDKEHGERVCRAQRAVFVACTAFQHKQLPRVRVDGLVSDVKRQIGTAVCGVYKQVLTDNYCKRYGAPQVIGYVEIKEV